MLSRLRDLPKSTSSPGYPSSILILELPADSVHRYALHIVTENGEVEHFGHTKSPTLRMRYAKEKSREQLGSVFLHVGDGEAPDQFLEEVSAHSTQLLEQQANSTSKETNGPAVDEILRSAALDALQRRENREAPKGAAQLYPVILVNIERSRSGKVLSEPRSIGP